MLPQFSSMEWSGFNLQVDIPPCMGKFFRFTIWETLGNRFIVFIIYETLSPLHLLPPPNPTPRNLEKKTTTSLHKKGFVFNLRFHIIPGVTSNVFQQMWFLKFSRNPIIFDFPLPW